MKTFRFILGYMIGFSVFIVLVPYALVYGADHTPFFPDLIFISSLSLRLIIAIPLFCTGLLFAVWSNVFLFTRGKGGPVDAFNVSVSPRSEKLVTTGPYKYCRNPMVFGALMLYISISVFLNSLDDLMIILALIPVFVLFLKFTEETRLLKDFGEEYLKYKSEVPMIIPFTQRRKRVKKRSGSSCYTCKK